LQLGKIRAYTLLHGEKGGVIFDFWRTASWLMTARRALSGFVRAPDTSYAADLVWLNHFFKFSGLTAL